MPSVSILRTLIENGWTIANRRNIVAKIGKSNFTEILSLANSANITDTFKYSDAIYHLKPENIQRTKSLLVDLITSYKVVVRRLKDYSFVSPNDFVEVYPNLFRTYYKHRDSTPIKPFLPYIDKYTLDLGISTKPCNSNVSLKGDYNQPIGTSGVGECAVIFMYNSLKKIHSLYHSYCYKTIESTASSLKKAMPEGFDKVIIVSGMDSETKNTSSTLFAAAKSINKDAIVKFKHSNTLLEQAQRLEDVTGAPIDTEFISYCGNVYEMPISLSDINKPLFKIGGFYE